MNNPRTSVKAASQCIAGGVGEYIIITLEVSIIYESFLIICKFTVHSKFPLHLTANFLLIQVSSLSIIILCCQEDEKHALTCQLANHRKRLLNYRNLYDYAQTVLVWGSLRSIRNSLHTESQVLRTPLKHTEIILYLSSFDVVLIQPYLFSSFTW